jgi:outer membrane lipoprotein SlyB
MKRIITGALCLSLTACATTSGPGGGVGARYHPVVDMQNVDMNKYTADVAQCQAYADQVSPMGNAAAGAAAGAIFGVILGALAGGNRGFNGKMAGMGAFGGGAGAAAGSLAKQQAIIMRCLAGRGDTVLG